MMGDIFAMVGLILAYLVCGIGNAWLQLDFVVIDFEQANKIVIVGEVILWPLVMLIMGCIVIMDAIAKAKGRIRAGGRER